MSNFILTETPGGTVLVEVEDTENVDGIDLVGITDKLPSFEQACTSLKTNAKFMLNLLEELAPEEVEISCGIKAGAEGGNTFWGLAATNAEASYTVKLTWKK